MTKIRTILTAGLLAALVAGTAACSTSQGGGDAENGTVRIGYQKGNTVNILKARGNLDERLAEEGYDVEWTELSIGIAVLEALNTGNIDFGHSSDANAVFSAAGGKPVEYAASETPYPTGVALVSKAGSGIDDVDDLVGRSVGVIEGGNMHYLLIRALEEAGHSIDDVDVKYYKAAADGLSAFQQGSFDVLGTWDPYLAIIQQTVDTTTVTDATGLADNRTFYFASEKLQTEDSEVLSIILDELQESDQWAEQNKDEAAQILADELGLDVEPLEAAHERRTFGVQPVDDAAVEAQQQLADTFYDAGLFDTPITIADYVTASPAWLPDSVR
ncbi:aliphatic sulfonate ABC transporter substrate-binding protein [Mycetocola reblochoni]|uniref:Alkanesulfonates-binding protein n=2 Tax=Mycetocola reblochoni TaxID=331618 RepID=A0A1R4IA57_9MICO|nr:aliphatic sulfonate ABC transporter substrate-binding protein [Mycetocola reblochoni]RLP70159.1 aliphatic sulfonate ABC transporter substrate-binding protein [Mycetocola reblochoni]SJN16725.1 Alkanesulfonates-binding protein [Mycetocola reblochoni REB411]